MQYSQTIDEIQFQSSPLEVFPFHDIQNLKSDDSSNDPAPEGNEQGNEEHQPVAKNKHNYTKCQKSKK